jgi:hypothetical protein
MQAALFGRHDGLGLAQEGNRFENRDGGARFFQGLRFHR